LETDDPSGENGDKAAKLKLINKQKQDWIQNYIDVNNECQQNRKTQNYEDERLITADNVISGNVSSNGSDEHETCASSDIEVISLPSLHSNKNTQQVTNDHPKQDFVLVKSPPPPHQPLEPQTKAQPEIVIEPDEFKTILETREIQIIKLNKQNVSLQETNDNLLTEIERLTAELQQKSNHSNYDDITRKYAQTQLDKENLRKLNDKLNDELNNTRRALNEKCEQVEQLIQEGSKLSKQEMNQLSVIKKLRAKEKETDEIISSLRSENKKFEKELEDLKKILDSKEESEKLNHGKLCVC
jgi:hypothetical protein